MARYDLPKAAPAPLRLVQLFVNTSDHEHGREWLPDPQALAGWLAEHDLGAGVRIRPADLHRALELREALRSLLWANNGRPAPPSAAETVNAVARSAVRIGVGADGAVAIEPYGSGVDAALGRIVSVAFGAMLDGSWSRLKSCPNCGWGFYDCSKNRSAGWCSMALCGNRIKTRAYRSRRAQRGGAA